MMTGIGKTLLAGGAAFLAVPGLAIAHPHVFIEMRSDVVFDDGGRVTAINVEWVFDPDYSTLAVEGLDANKDGVYDPSELEPLARENIEALKEWNYFVYAKYDGKKLDYGPIKEYGNRWLAAGKLELHFEVPLAEPVDPLKGAFGYKIYDPTFYIAIDFVGDKPVEGLGTVPLGCRVDVGPVVSDQQVQETRDMLAQQGKDWAPPEEEDFGALFAQPVKVLCKPKAS